jgi:HEAT repeat protein
MGILDFVFGPPNVGELGSKKDVKGLVKALRYKKKEPFRVREEAAKALGMIGDKRAVEPLIQALNDSDKLLE